MAIDAETLAAENAEGVSKELVRIASQGGTEADFRREVARLLQDVGARAGLTIIPRDEFSVARGRVDSVYNRLVLEYKRPGVIRESNEGRSNQVVINQVKDYILNVAKRERRETQRLAGVATDGFYFIFVRRVGEGWSVDDPAPVSPNCTERFLRLLFSLSAGAALVPENLVEDFGPKTLRAQRAVRSLYTALHASKHPLVGKLFEQWRLFFSEATDYKEWAERIESKEEFRSFVKGMGLDPKYAEAPRVFFALHTYYALLIKLIASLVAARFAGDRVAPLSSFANKPASKLREAFENLERGGLFREYGIRNFLEGDFFGWYLAAWDHDIEEATSKLVQRLAEYDPGTLELAPENARDLLKKLYHYLLPREIRHDLGEYYTPDWLAERLVIQTLGRSDLGDPTKRVLDPACGSGTFFVILIKYIKESSARRQMAPADVLDLILRNVIGFDLNPLAVIAARTNYLLALGDLLKARKGDIDIPVYQADSVLTPSRGSDLFTGSVYPLKTSVGEFRVPAIFAERERIDALANVLDESVESGVGIDAFLVRLKAKVSVPAKDFAEAEGELVGLFERLRELHDQGLNGVWARIIKNAFAPLFIERCDYIVGNPPWVNWESLPDDYRRSTMPLWEHYGLFPKREGGMATILGAAKYDFSSLMTYVALDKYLHRQGKLGFVLTQTLFKTAGAAQGFRRFELPDRTPVGPLLVEDMVELKPFEGAANRTSVAIIEKGHKIRYPVPYTYWYKTTKGKGIDFDTPYQTVTSDFAAFKRWCAEPIDGDDLTSAWLTEDPSVLKTLRRVCGNSDYQARKGVTCSANGVFWIEKVGTRPSRMLIVTNVVENVKKKVASVQAAIEQELVYPLLRGMDVNRWNAKPEISIIVPHKPGMRLKAIPEREMQSDYPKTWGYLKKFEGTLRTSGIFRRFFKTSDPFYSLFNVGDYTFAPAKVVWREVSNDLQCAVVGASEGLPIIPDHTLTMLETSSLREAHYICGALNSAPARLVVRSYIALHPSPHVLKNIKIPQFIVSNRIHIQLADLSSAAHKAMAKGDTAEVKNVEQEIDRAAGKLWSLSDHELGAIKRSLGEA